MNILLRVVAGLVMALGLCCLIATAVLLLLEEERMRVRFRDHAYVIVAIVGSGTLVAFGGMLWAITRLAYRPHGLPIPPEISALTDSRPPQVRLYSLGSVLRMTALLQIGIGLTAFAGFYLYLLLSPLDRNRPSLVVSILLGSILSLGYTSIGGILFALTRIAYPPTQSRPAPTTIPL